MSGMDQWFCYIDIHVLTLRDELFIVLCKTQNGVDMDAVTFPLIVDLWIHDIFTLRRTILI